MRRYELLATRLAAQRPSLEEAAQRLGHRVDTLVANYVGALQDEESVGNLKIERFLDGESDR